MRYEKTALTFEEQADQLLERGLSADRATLVKRLEAVSYYRLSGYLYPFRSKESDQFIQSTNLDEVWSRYCFDRRLRVLLIDAIERIEVSVRTKLVYHFTHQHGPFGYLIQENLPKLNKASIYLEWRLSLEEETARSKEKFREHFNEKYGDEHKSLPLWMLAELMSMGSLLTFYNGISADLKNQIANEYGFADKLFLSWLRSLYGIRNLCAHHARLWNRELGYSTLKPPKNKYPDWHTEPSIRNDRVGIILFICRNLLAQISPTSKWYKRVEVLMEEYPSIPALSMGLPQNWKDNPLWKI